MGRNEQNMCKISNEKNGISSEKTTTTIKKQTRRYSTSMVRKLHYFKMSNLPTLSQRFSRNLGADFCGNSNIYGRADNQGQPRCSWYQCPDLWVHSHGLCGTLPGHKTLAQSGGHRRLWGGERLQPARREERFTMWDRTVFLHVDNNERERGESKEKKMHPYFTT